MELDYSRLGAKGFPQPLARVYLLQGSDDALKQEATEKLASAVLDPGMAEFDRENRDVPPGGAGVDSDAARQILASAGGAPFMSERRVVVVTNVHRLGKEDQEILAAGVAALGAQTCLILVAGAPEYEGGKVKGRAAVGTKLAGAIAKAGVVVLCNAPAEGDLKARATALVRSRDKTIEPAALQIILRRAVATASDRGGGGKSGDIHAMTGELEKVLAYVGERPTITAADALAVSSRTADENIWALLDSVGRREHRRSLAQVDELLRAGDKPDGVAARTFVMLARHLRLLWGAKYLAERRLTGDRLRGGLPDDVQAVLSGEMIGMTARQSYTLRSLQEQARGWSYDELRLAIARTLESDMAMKGITPVRPLGGPAPAWILRRICGFWW